MSACMLYYRNTVRWAWLDWSLSGWLTTFLQWIDTVGWVIRPVKPSSGRITYIVLVQTLNHAQSINQYLGYSLSHSFHSLIEMVHTHVDAW